jgi:hypothetical protein
VSTDRELAIQAHRHDRGWVMISVSVPLQPGVGWQLGMMLNTGRPQSVLSRPLGNVLSSLGLLHRRGRGQYVLRDPAADGQPLPGMVLRLSAGPALLDLDGMIGLDVLDQFTEVRLNTHSLRLTPIR